MTDKPSTLKIWLAAIRPATLTASVVPVLVGGALAFSADKFLAPAFLAALTGAIFIQIAVNFHNDYEDFVRGADTEDRLGQARVTQKGWMSPRQVLSGAVLSVFVLIGCAAYLFSVAGWPVVAIAAASIISGWAYTGGPMPMGYLGLGDLFVLVFFGFVAVGGTYYVQALSVDMTVMLTAAPVGLLGTNILVVNNLRDRVTDVKVGKKTLVVRFGERFGRLEYKILLILSYLCPLFIWLGGLGDLGWMLCWLSLPLALKISMDMDKVDGRDLNPYLGKTAMLQVLFGLLLAGGILL